MSREALFSCSCSSFFVPFLFPLATPRRCQHISAKVLRSCLHPSQAKECNNTLNLFSQSPDYRFQTLTCLRYSRRSCAARNTYISSIRRCSCPSLFENVVFPLPVCLLATIFYRFTQFCRPSVFDCPVSALLVKLREYPEQLQGKDNQRDDAVDIGAFFPSTGLLLSHYRIKPSLYSSQSQAE